MMDVGGKRKLKVLAIDFDGVISEWKEWGGKGPIPKEKLRPGIKKLMTSLKKEGWYIIVWTARLPENVIKAKKFLKKHKLPYDKLNDNIYKWKSRKVVADVYLDDRNIEFKGVCDNKLLKRIKNFEPYWSK